MTLSTALSLFLNRHLYRWIGGCLLLTISVFGMAEEAPSAEEETTSESIAKATESFSPDMIVNLFQAEQAFLRNDFSTAFNIYWAYAQEVKSAQFAEQSVRLLMVQPYLQWLASEGLMPGGQSLSEDTAAYRHYRRYIMSFPSEEFAAESTRPLIFVMRNDNIMTKEVRDQWESRLRTAADYWFSLDETSSAAFGMVLSTHLILGPEDTIPDLFKQALARHPEKANDYWKVTRGIFQGISPGSPYDRPDLIAQLVTLSPDTAEAHMAVAEMAIRKNDHVLALEELKKASQLQPDWDDPLVLRVKILLLQNEVDASKTLLQDFIKKYPKNRTIKLLLGKLHVALGEDKAAYDLYKTLVVDYPEDPELAMQAGQLAFKLEKYDEADSHLQQVILFETDGDKKDQALVGLAESAQQLKKYDEAIEWIDQIDSGETRLVAYRSFAGYIFLYEKDRIPQATDALLSAYEGAEGELQLGYAYMLTTFLRETDQEPRLRVFLREALVNHPSDPLLLYESGMTAERDGDYDQFEAALRRLIEVQPDYAHGYNALGYSLVERNVRLEEAKELLDKAIALAPNDPYIQDSVGWLEFRQGNYQKAIEWLTKSYIATQSAEVAAHLGEVYWAVGEQEKARQVWRSGLNREPSHPVLLKTIERLNGQPL